MEDNKVVELNIKSNKKEEPEKKQVSSFSTNPILKKMFFVNINNKKGKFSFKDLFK